jgi:type IV pilus assembly protein PilX
MMSKTQKQFQVSPRSQSGAVLVIGLIMLLLITIIGMASVRGTNMQEIMAGNMRDRNLAFQTAESGLRIGEATIETLGGNPFSGNGLWRDLNITKAGNPIAVHQWTATEWTTANNAITVVDASFPVAPSYAIEYIFVPPKAIAEAVGSCAELDCQAPKFDFYRLSSRGTGASGLSEVVLQSFYRTVINN